ncbi:hypothetical protein M4914_10960 [Streptomyces somaliensis DSM 40738]|uniref:DUF6571 domain-containing protein n=1 Tax=Streptomyces somaliensis (strain ATCC 33201 / DSM 40738 / JCM 12659 / KCTC 9044 / NCTC 11332 / NRRL B-12077 / IP 733) TaxID=1134445 RepID=A0AA44DAR4_STRE0|nr:DUF6571 family protein [Streptomyces somaliensis]MCQ0023418.1 hypothetical protein [Streptomyces somaliensis DSM 40738]NKY13277.1 hypothetical protein [Streptomyces somaliensis DSM 40738]
MDFEALHSANFTQLDGTVADWSGMVRRLGQLEKDAREGLQGKAAKADWAGYNAAVSRAFVGKTAGEFADAHTQAASIRNILRDARDELKTQQRLLKEAVERGRGKDLTVRVSGSGFTVTPNPGSASAGADKDATALRDELQRILDKATEIDDSAAKVLRALVDLTDHGFSGARYKDRDSAAAALRDAERLAKLAGKDPADFTVEDFDALNAGLRKHSGDELFAERFAEKLGAGGTLRFWAGINNPAVNGDVGRARLDQLDDLQKHLSLTLATATQADTLEMVRWRGEMVDLGGQPVHKNSAQLGFQVMSNLMRWGNFEDGFLKDYGSALMQREKESSDNGRHASPLWSRLGADPLLNRTGTDSGSDPLVGFLRALSNNPGAATDFFNSSFLTKDDDHEFMIEGKNEKAELSNFDYLFEERKWPQNMDGKGEESIAGHNYLAMALEAATTGHPAGQLPSDASPPHTAAQARLMESLVAAIGEKPELLKDHGYMSDSIGQIVSEYLPDINRSISGDPTSEDVMRLFPISGAPAPDLNHADVTRLLLLIGQNPESYAAVEVGQKAYMANLLDYHMNPDLPKENRYTLGTEDTVKEIVRSSSEVSGILAIGRQEAVLGEAKQDDQDYINAMNKRKSLVSGVIGLGIGVGTSFVASPLVGAAAGGAANTVAGVVIEQAFQDVEGENTKGRSREVAGYWEESREKNARLGMSAVKSAAEAHSSPYTSQAAEWGRTSSRQGFNDASVSVGQMAKDLQTPS